MTYESIDDVAMNISWPLLAQQRRTLAELAGSDVITRDQRDAIDGVVNLLYELASAAVAEGIAEEHEAFIRDPENEESP